jgi:urease accessory protein UreF
MLTMEVKQTSDKTVTAKDSWKDFMAGLASSIYVIKNVAAALKDMYGAMADANKQTFGQTNAAAGMGIGAKDFQSILNGGSLVGISPDVTQKGLQAFKAEMADIRATGTLNTAQATAMGILGLQIDKESQKSPQAGIADVVDAALKKAVKDGDPGAARVLATKAAGGASSLVDAMFDALMNKTSQERGFRTAEDLFSRGSQLNFTTNGGITGASQFTLSLDALTAALGSIGKEASGKVGGALTPLHDALTQWLIDNKAEIEQAINGLVDAIKDVTSLLRIIFPKQSAEDHLRNSNMFELSALSKKMVRKGSYDYDPSLLTEEERKRFYDLSIITGSMKGETPALTKLFDLMDIKYNEGRSISRASLSPPSVYISTGDPRTAREQVYSSNLFQQNPTKMELYVKLDKDLRAEGKIVDGSGKITVDRMNANSGTK